MSECFLIADEVGLGKTKSARTVLFEMIRCREKEKKDGIHAIYIASSIELANQNMKAEFLNGNTVGCQKDNFSDLASFQKRNVVKVMQVFFRDYTYPDTNISPKMSLSGITGDFTRLSEYTPDMCKKNYSYLMSLSPKTSFFIPSNSLTEGYKGSITERKALKSCFEQLYLRMNNNEERKLSNTELDELKLAIELDIEKVNKNTADIQETVKNICREIFENIYEDADRTNQTQFLKARRYRNNASAALYKPELIILDEFQRYRGIFEETKEGYSIYEMIKYLKKRYKRDSSYSPKILLLSATPYNYNCEEMEPIQWGYGSNGNMDSYDARTKQTEKPYEDFKSLINTMKKLGADKNADSNCIARTERSMFSHSNKQNKEKDSIQIVGADKDLVVNNQKDYLNPIVKYCYDSFNYEDIRVINAEIVENPEFWRFNYGYKQRTRISDGAQKVLLKSSIPNYSVEKNIGLQQLEQVLFFNDSKMDIPRLWVPPVSTGKQGFGKTLVFTTMQVTTRSVAYFVNQMAISRISSYKGYRKYDSSDICEENFKRFIYDNMIRPLEEAKLDDKKMNATICVMKEFFNRPFVKRVIAAYTSSEQLSYLKAIEKYCKDFEFASMLKEYRTVLGTNYSLDKVLRAFSHLPSSIIEWTLDKNDEIRKQYINVDYSEMFVCDDNKAGRGNWENGYNAECDVDQDREQRHRTCKSLNEICDQFNSPIYPMMLVSRNTGQEGFNLQYYGDKIMHWQMAANVNAFMQREGRLDRPGSLVFREKVWKWVKDQGKKDKDYVQAREFFEKNFQDKYMSCGISRESYESGISPLWNFEYGDIKIKQILPIYEYSDVFYDFVKEIVAVEQYSKFYDNIDELCPFLDENLL